MERRKDKHVTVDISSLTEKQRIEEENKYFLPCAWEEHESGGIDAPGDDKLASMRDDKVAKEIQELMKGKQELRLLSFNFLIGEMGIIFPVLVL